MVRKDPLCPLQWLSLWLTGSYRRSFEMDVSKLGTQEREERPEQRQTDKTRLDTSRLPQVMEEERPDVPRQDSSESTSSDDLILSSSQGHDRHFGGDTDSDLQTQYTPTSTLDGISPFTGPLTGFSSGTPSWNSQSHSRTRGGSLSGVHDLPKSPPNGVASPAPQRPKGPARIVSSTYQPDRRPQAKVPATNGRKRSYSIPRPKTRDPQASYRAQEQAYIQQLRQDLYNDYVLEEPYTPSLSYSTDSENEEESPSSEFQLENDMYDQDPQLFYNTDGLQPSEEELSIPANRERLEWHGMLATVLKGDVVKQEKQRLNGTSERAGEKSLNNELWLGIRARVCGRTVPAQRRMIEEPEDVWATEPLRLRPFPL